VRKEVKGNNHSAVTVMVTLLYTASVAFEIETNMLGGRFGRVKTKRYYGKIATC